MISDTRSQASDVRNTLGELGTRVQDVIDAADAQLPLIPYMDPAAIEGLAIQWSQVAHQTVNLRSVLDDAQYSTDSASGTATLTSVVTSSILSRVILPYEDDGNFGRSWEHFVEVTSRPEKKLDVARLMKEFRLDNAPAGNKSPLELFHIAHQAYESPISMSNPASTSLLPMREAIEATLDELVRLRPEQQEVGHGNRRKIRAICAQLKKETISDLVVQEWADQGYEICHIDLSSAKRQHLSRNEWSRRLTRATLFLYSFLIGLDSSKLRR